MTFFFLVVGLEAKREFDLGELRERRRLAVPVLAAIGGMVVPIAIYLAFNAGGPGAHGWGAAMSTDTAFALGALALLTPRAATRLRVFLLTLAVVDDLGALRRDRDRLHQTRLGRGAGSRRRVCSPRCWRCATRPPGVARRRCSSGVALWVAMFKSGVDPVISGLAVGLGHERLPARARGPRAGDRSWRARSASSRRPSSRARPSGACSSAISPNERLQYSLHPWTSYVIVPLFALANAGVHMTGTLLGRRGHLADHARHLRSAMSSASRSASSAPRGSPRGPRCTARGRRSAGRCSRRRRGRGDRLHRLAADLEPRLHRQRLDEAKLGVLGSAIVAPLVAWVIFRLVRRLPSSVRARQISGTAEDLLDLVERCRPRARPHPRARGRARDARRVRRLRVPVLRAGRGGDPRAAGARSTTTCATSGATCRSTTSTPTRSWPPRRSRRPVPRASSGRCTTCFSAHQDELALRDLAKIAEELGLESERFCRDVRRHEYAPRVAEDVASADESGVSGTPTFFINGRRH